MAIALAYTFTPRTTILSAEVNANFNLLSNRAVDKTGDTLTGTILTQNLVPNVTGTYDLGSSSTYYRSLYLRTSLSLQQTNGAYDIRWNNPAATRVLTIDDPLGADQFVFRQATQTLYQKTIVDPTIVGTLTGTYTLGGTPTITSPIITSPTVTGGTFASPTITGTIVGNIQASGEIRSQTNLVAEGFVYAAALPFGTGELGNILLSGRNTSGAGAPGLIQMQDRNGTNYYLWFDTSGILRTGSPPDESLSDVIGTAVGDQVG